MPEVSVSIPRAGQAVVEGNIEEWLVPDGTVVTEGDPIYVLETDKVSMEVVAPVSGTLSILLGVGGPYAVGTEIARIHAS